MPMVAIIPAYDAEVHLREIISRARLYVDKVVVVDDGSDDATAFIAESMEAILVQHEVNRGKALALKTGFEEASKHDPAIIVTLYANGRHNPDDIPKITSPIMRKEADVVCGCYSGEEECPAEVSDFIHNTCGFSAFSPAAYEQLKFTETGDGVETEMLREAEDAGCRFKGVQLYKASPEKEHLLQEHKIGVVVPAYNEEKLIVPTIEGIPEYVDRIYVINDYSTDNTAEVLNSIEDPRLFVINHETNKGVGAALISGYKRALKEDMDIVAIRPGTTR